MSEHNVPMVLPNGYVYSVKGIERIQARNGGRVVCPHTGQAYAPEEVRRAFVV